MSGNVGISFDDGTVAGSSNPFPSKTTPASPSAGTAAAAQRVVVASPNISRRLGASGHGLCESCCAATNLALPKESPDADRV